MAELPRQVPLFRREAVLHRADSIFGAILLPEPTWLRYIVRAVVALVICIALILVFGSYTKRSQATGYVTLVPGPANIASPAAGVISKIHVRDGDTVAKGQLLLEITKARASATAPNVEAEIVGRLKQARANLVREIDIQRDLAQQNQHSADEEIVASRATVERLKGLAALAQDRARLVEADARRAEALVRKRLLPQKSLDDSRNAVLSAQIAAHESEQRLSDEAERLRSKEAARSGMPLQMEEQEGQLKSRLAALEQQIYEVDSAATTAIYSPIEGVVTGSLLSVGESIVANARLFMVVPIGATFQAQMLVPSRDAGFLHPGMQVWIRYDAFPYQKFGQYAGRIERVDQTVLTPEEQSGPIRLNEPAYRVVVALDRQDVAAYGKSVALQSGLTFRAAISQERERLIDLVLDPLNAARRGAY